MLHYHILDAKPKTIDMRLEPVKDKLFKACNLSFAWTDKAGHWQGDKYNPDGMCINHCREDLEDYQRSGAERCKEVSNGESNS